MSRCGSMVWAALGACWLLPAAAFGQPAPGAPKAAQAPEADVEDDEAEDADEEAEDAEDSEAEDEDAAESEAEADDEEDAATAAVGQSASLSAAPPSPATGAAQPPPSAATADSAMPPEGPGGELGTHQQHLQVMLGVRASYLTDYDYRLFTRTAERLADTYPTAQLTLGGGGTVWTQQALSLVVLGLWDYGGGSSEIRGEETDIDIHRLAVGVELRHHYHPWLYSMARAAPAALNTRASIKDSAADTTLYARNWSFGFDLCVGAGVRIFGKPEPASPSPRGWLLGEIGYGWANATDLRFSPDEDDNDAPQRTDEIDLGELAIRGPMFRISGAVTF